MGRWGVLRPAWPAAVLGLVACWGCGQMEIASVWADRQVATDGVPAEWEGATTWIEEPNSAIGVLNDGEYLYLCFSSPLKSVAAQVIRQGLTVWFDPDGKREKTFGIRCASRFVPPPEAESGVRPGKRDESRPPASPPGGLPADVNAAGGLEAQPLAIQVLGPADGEAVDLAPGDPGGIEFKLGNSGGRVVCEVRVPLRASAAHPYAIGVTERGLVGIGLETPEARVEGRPEGLPQGMPGGGPPGDGGGPGGGPGDGGGEGMGGSGAARGGPGGPGTGPGGGAAAERLQVWGRIRLASQAPGRD